ncbi:LysR substrate-binding domain-containing protein [Roseateles sp.]|uniref:LysR family transcriptional regulator n=1 Tax=Roseateles sp. TaxID=1971397 RepID=UPI0039EC7F81
MDKFLEMKAFAAVVDAGSFVKAADTLEVSKAAVSRYVAELEARLGVRLLHRTTRKLSLTPEGEVFNVRCRELLSGLDEAEAEVSSHSGEASGLLRINAPFSFGLLHLAPLWPEFMARHPSVTLDVTLADRVVDLVEEGFDMAVRIGRLPTSSLVSRPLASTRLVLCASPEYLRRRGAPSHPSELASHDVLTYSLFSMGDQWEFIGPEGAASVKVTPRLRTNNGDTCRVAALCHQGIVLQPTFLVGPDLMAGTLMEVMPGWRSVELGVYAVYPTRKFLSPKVRVMIEFLVSAFGKAAWPA